jgi:hypothetical protein
MGVRSQESGVRIAAQRAFSSRNENRILVKNKFIKGYLATPKDQIARNLRDRLLIQAKIKRRPLGSGTGSPNSFAVSIQRRIAS